MFNWIVSVTKQYLELFNFDDMSTNHIYTTGQKYQTTLKNKEKYIIYNF